MTNLHFGGSSAGEKRKHAIFLHGLGGHYLKTWTSTGEKKEFWPTWLCNDVAGLTVWSVGYNASISRYTGKAMSLPNRATNILELLLAEEELKKGEIILLGHSLGGLVIKEMLRTAESRARIESRIADFLSRVRRVGFFSTPHIGSNQASFLDRLRILVKPSAAINCLVKNDPNLFALNRWYRERVHAQPLEHVNLIEMQNTYFFFRIVSEESADLGIIPNPVPVDANHISICKPKDKGDYIYQQIRSFLARESLISPVVELSQVVASLDAVSLKIAGIDENQSEISDKLKNLSTHSFQPQNRIPVGLIDQQIEKDLRRIRLIRFFEEHASQDTEIFSRKLVDGEYSSGSSKNRCIGLAWCSRILASTSMESAKEHLIQAKSLGSCEEVTFAESVKIAYEGHLEEALSLLVQVDSPASRSLGLILVNKEKGFMSAREWLSGSLIRAKDLDPDGQLVYALELIKSESWGEALVFISGVESRVFDSCPGLHYFAGIAYFASTIVDEQRAGIVSGIPINPGAIRMASTDEANRHRGIACTHFRRAAEFGKDFECAQLARLAEDFVLWLELLNPTEKSRALDKLRGDLSGDKPVLRRLNLAVAFGLGVDVNAIEKEIDRVMMVSGGKSIDACVARLVICHIQETPEKAYQYIQRHRQQLIEALDPRAIGQAEFLALVSSGNSDEAKAVLDQPSFADLSVDERTRLLRVIQNIAADTGIDELEAAFQQSNSLSDLSILVEKLAREEYFEKLLVYAEKLFDRTKALSDAERLVNAQYNCKKYLDVKSFASKYKDLIEQSVSMHKVLCWSLFANGDVIEAKNHLSSLRVNHPSANERMLQIQLSISSGMWSEISALADSDWRNKELRSPEDLLQMAQLAQIISHPRAKDLLLEAAERSTNDPQTLANAYFVAVKAGWEAETPSGSWLNSAINASNDSGPLKRVSLDELIKQAPEWNEKTSNAYKMVREGKVPLAAAAQLINKSLCDVFVRPAIANLEERDPRKRSLIYAYSGNRARIIQSGGQAGIDGTALLTLAQLDLLDKLSSIYQKLVVPHSTLHWLFSEYQNIAYHQPSKIRESSEIIALMSEKCIGEFSCNSTPDAKLVDDVGIDFATLIVEAEQRSKIEKKQYLVVKSSPIVRVGSLVDERVDVSRFQPNICSAYSVIAKLRQMGRLTVTEEERARAYFSIHENPNQPITQIEDNASLVLDSLAVIYFLHTSLIRKIYDAGLRVFVSVECIQEANAFIKHDKHSVGVRAIIERTRAFLAASISSGEICVAAQAETEGLSNHASRQNIGFAIVEVAGKVDEIVSDDRFFNQYANIASAEKNAKTVTSYDVLMALFDKKLISLPQYLECKSKLRNMGYIFLPLDELEITNCLSSASLVGDEFKESAEARALRENLAAIRFGKRLQLPNDELWFASLLGECTRCIHAVWISSESAAAKKAKSDWLISLISLERWASCYPPERQEWFAMYGEVEIVSTLLLGNSNFSKKILAEYSSWIENRFLSGFDSERMTLLAEKMAEITRSISVAVSGNSQQ